MPELDDRWKTWIWQNVGRGCDKDHVFKALLDRGFGYEAIRDELGHEPSTPLERIEVPMVSGSSGLSALDPSALAGKELAPSVWELPGLLSPADCDVLIRAASEGLVPSGVVTDHDRAGEDGTGRMESRTSSGLALDATEPRSPELVAVLSYLRRIVADLTHLPADHQEPFQLLRYAVDERFDPHHDAFTAGSEYLRWEGLRGGQRLFSFMVYLNQVEAGGETVFPELGLTVDPAPGKGILWPNVVGDGRPYGASLHGSLPVTRGEKWVLVCWVREAPFGRPREGPGISDLRGLDAWLPPPIPIGTPAWLREETAKQLQEVPYLDAGGPSCRGFERRRLDDPVYGEILAAWRAVAHELRIEEGGAIDRYLRTVRPELPPALYYEVEELNRLVHDLLKPLHEEWCRFALAPSACYGFRVYLPGAFLHDHVDRPRTHVISSTLCVDRDVYAPWPLHAIDADGGDHQLDLEPGELLLYESARIVHGRPTPLNGRYHVGLFVHYRPAEDAELWAESPVAWYQKHLVRAPR